MNAQMNPRTVARSRRIVRSALKVTAAAADVGRRTPGLVVLLYHRVGDGQGEIDLPVARFEEQLDWLGRHRRVVSLDDAVNELADVTVPTPQPVVVTFDDGTADFSEVVLPRVVRHGVPVTLFVATAYVEEQRDFPWGSRPVTWSGLAEAVSTGLVSIGSHTHTHALLDRAAPDAAADELDRSRSLIEDRLGIRCDHFAYPKALPPAPGVEGLVRQRFVTAALAGTRPNPYGATDLHRLARSPVQTSDGMRWFRRKAGGGMALEDTLRSALNRRRYTGATT